MIPVILSGGSGTRMWPYSRAMYPKQLLPLVSDKSMLQETILRLKDMHDVQQPWLVCNEEHRFLVAEQLRNTEMPPAGILLEPIGRNTAPAITLAALSVNPDDIILVLPADHVIKNITDFQIAIKLAMQQAHEEKLVTFGIIPSKPETGYGYIRAGSVTTSGVYQVAEFVEKPDKVTAEKYVDSGDYSWNSGMFMFKARCFLDELKKFSPGIIEQCQKALAGAEDDLDFVRVAREAFEQCPDDSIDYAVMEKTDQAVVIPVDIGWSDVGSWSTLWEVSEKDTNGNMLKGDILTHNTQNCFIQNDKKLIATVGVKDLVVVETDDSILVADKQCVQEVKQIVKGLQEANRPETDFHRKVYRPWGYYDSIENGENYQVKRLAVYPGAKLSLQKHQHRAEHWVVVSGVARVVNGDREFDLQVNESTYIPIGAVHQLSNLSDTLLEIIEVQSGTYLGEDDIERLEDVYGRA